MTSDSVFVPIKESKSEEIEVPLTSTASPEPRGSTRSAKGQSAVRHGKVYTFSATTSNALSQPGYNETVFIPCNIID